MRNHKIFVVNFAGHDISSALEFTDLPKRSAFMILTEGSVHIFDIDRVVYDLKQGLKKSGSEDYLLPSGSALLSAIAICLWLELHQRVKLLIYHAKEKKYVLKEIKKDQLITP